MATHISATAYDPVGRPHKFVVGRPAGTALPRSGDGDAGRAETPPAASRPGDLAPVEQALQLLGRAVRQVHTAPAASPLCTDAIAACAKALGALEGRDEIVARVTLHDLVVDEFDLGRGTVIEQELVHRLHRARVAALTIDRAATLRDLSRFCSDLISLREAGGNGTTLAELLTEHGVDKIVVRMAYRPEVVDVGAPAAPLCDLLERERGRRETMSATGPAAHLYPPDKGWVRLDPTTGFTTISLVDLAILVNDPAEFAGVLLRLTDGEPAASGSPQTALELKFSDVATVFASLDPRLAQLMFARLARAVLELGPAQRQSLLQRTILPGALDGRADGRVLAEFPDVDLAESLCLLLDLETAAPEVLPAALDRMNLSAERRQTLAPLLDAGIRERMRAGRLPNDDEKIPGIDRYARKLLQVNAAAPGTFAEFAAFDLSVDDQTSTAIAEVRSGVESADALVARMQCLSNLVRLEPNPGVVEDFLAGVSTLLGELERAARWQDVVSWLAHHRQLAAALHEGRPDVADAIAAAVQSFCTPERAIRIVELYDEGGERRALASMLVNAYGPAVAPAFVALLDDPAVQGKTRSLVPLMVAHAKMLAPALARQIGRAGKAAAGVAVRVLGFAGPGYEAAIAGQFERGNEQVVREGLRALARIGTAHAAALVSAQVRHANAWVRNAAQEALCRFPPQRAQAQLLDLLGRRDFVHRHPDAAARLLDRAVQADSGSLRVTLAALVPLRYRFWHPALARVGTKARDILQGRATSRDQTDRR